MPLLENFHTRPAIKYTVEQTIILLARTSIMYAIKHHYREKFPGKAEPPAGSRLLCLPCFLPTESWRERVFLETLTCQEALLQTSCYFSFPKVDDNCLLLCEFHDTRHRLGGRTWRGLRLPRDIPSLYLYLHSRGHVAIVKYSCTE